MDSYERMVKPPTNEQLLADAHSYPTMQSIIDQQRQDVERAAIAEFKAKYGDKPYSCKWEMAPRMIRTAWCLRLLRLVFWEKVR